MDMQALEKSIVLLVDCINKSEHLIGERRAYDLITAEPSLRDSSICCLPSKRVNDHHRRRPVILLAMNE